MNTINKLASLALSGVALLSGTANASTAVQYPAGFVAIGGVVPHSLSFLVWAPVLTLTLGCVIGLLVLIARDSREVAKPGRDSEVATPSSPEESRYDLKKAA
ncbi:MAG: hypothetical protein ACRETN_09875 [Nevskiales bacterium]